MTQTTEETKMVNDYLDMYNEEDGSKVVRIPVPVHVDAAGKATEGTEYVVLNLRALKNDKKDTLNIILSLGGTREHVRFGGRSNKLGFVWATNPKKNSDKKNSGFMELYTPGEGAKSVVKEIPSKVDKDGNAISGTEFVKIVFESEYDMQEDTLGINIKLGDTGKHIHIAGWDDRLGYVKASRPRVNKKNQTETISLG